MTLCAWCLCRWVDDICYQLTFFFKKLQQVKGLSQALLSKASPLLVIPLQTHYAYPRQILHTLFAAVGNVSYSFPLGCRDATHTSITSAQIQCGCVSCSCGAMPSLCCLALCLRASAGSGAGAAQLVAMQCCLTCRFAASLASSLKVYMMQVCLQG